MPPLTWLWIVLLSLQLLTLLGWLFLAFSPTRRGNLEPQLDPLSEMEVDASALPSVAILCPGRNEESWAPLTLPTLCQQRLVNHRVVFIDDQSSDRTGAIIDELAAQHPQLLAVHNQVDPPPGWVGKCWAVQQGYLALQQAEERDGQRAQWLCFTDADIVWHPDCLAAALRHALAENADVVGLFPAMEYFGVSDRIAVLSMVLALVTLFPFRKAMDPKHPDTLTGGAFILVRRELYESIGGHQAVAGQMVEDLALGRALKAAGGKVRLAVTPVLLRARMYDDFADMWEGLTKNAFAGVNYSWLRAGALLCFACLGGYGPVLLLLAAAGQLLTTVLTGQPAHTAGWWNAAGALACGTLLAQALVAGPIARTLKLTGGYRWALPAGAALYSTFMLASMWRSIVGGNRWKGRAYRRVEIS